MQWRKKGFIFAPDSGSWMHSYAQVPTPLLLEDRVRVFFGCRPKGEMGQKPISRIGFVDLDIDNFQNVIGISQNSVLSLGGLGTFDEFGLHPISVVKRDSSVWLYYVGWTRMESVPFNRAIGLAVSDDNGLTFERYGRGPILGATVNEPFLQQGPTVRRYQELWHMWYLSGLDWIEDGSRKECVYQIMHATSHDGIDWVRDGKPCIPSHSETECHAGQAVILRDGIYHMWFSYRPALNFRNAERGYRIGYAWSQDLIEWHRDDQKAGIDVSLNGWDSEMICYPSIIERDDQVTMFYCGNYFGRDGFGFAVLER